MSFDFAGRLSEIVCLTRDVAASSRLTHFKYLHGIHISFLNNIVEKFRDEDILDLFDFFAEPWAFALLDQKFQVFVFAETPYDYSILYSVID